MTSAVNEAPVPTGMFAGMAGGAVKKAGTDDKDMFLKLLVAQMKYQDPMNPTDSTQFLSQNAQFTALEKMQSVADQTAQMVATQMAFGASNLVGRSVSYLDAKGTAVTGTVQGVNFAAGGPQLDVDGVAVALAAVQSVTSSGSTKPAEKPAEPPATDSSVPDTAA